MRTSLKWSTIAAVAVFAAQIALAQDAVPMPMPVPMPAPVTDPWVALLGAAGSTGPLAGVIMYVAYSIGKGLGSWTPTVRVIHENAQWDGTERRKGVSDR